MIEGFNMMVKLAKMINEFAKETETLNKSKKKICNQINRLIIMQCDKQDDIAAFKEDHESELIGNNYTIEWIERAIAKRIEDLTKMHELLSVPVKEKEEIEDNQR